MYVFQPLIQQWGVWMPNWHVRCFSDGMTSNDHKIKDTTYCNQWWSQVAGECYTAVEVGQKTPFVLALSTSVCLCISHLCAIALLWISIIPAITDRWQSLQNANSSAASKRQCVFGWSQEYLPREAKTSLARVQAHCLLIKPPPTQLSL